MLSKPGKLAPLRTSFQWEDSARQFMLHPMTGLVDPPTAATLELQKLAGISRAGGKVRGLLVSYLFSFLCRMPWFSCVVRVVRSLPPPRWSCPAGIVRGGGKVGRFWSLPLTFKSTSLLQNQLTYFKIDLLTSKLSSPAARRWEP